MAKAKLIVTVTFTAEHTSEFDPAMETLVTIRQTAERDAKDIAVAKGGKLQRFAWRVEEGDEISATGSKYVTE
jgi:hypothetical protein